jgi:hypothetical protein
MANLDDGNFFDGTSILLWTIIDIDEGKAYDPHMN